MWLFIHHKTDTMANQVRRAHRISESLPDVPEDNGVSFCRRCQNIYCPGEQPTRKVTEFLEQGHWIVSPVFQRRGRGRVCDA